MTGPTNRPSRRRSALAAVAVSGTATLLLAACVTGAGSSSASPTPPGTATRAGSSAQAGVQPAATAYADWPTYHGSTYRGGFAATMPAVKGAPTVTHRIALDGAVYASPIVVRGITVVATENDTVYAFDSAFRQIWKAHLGTPSPAGERPCGDIDPLGITGTPAYSATTGLVYVAPEFKGVNGAAPTHQLWALSLTTGHTSFHRSIDLPGVDRAAMQERGALAIAGNDVFIPFGGLAGDCGQYKGRVVAAYLRGTGGFNSFTVPTAREAGIWTPPGPTIDAANNVFVAVGNGESGVGDPYDYSDSVLKLGYTLTRADSFSPTTWPTDNDSDLDLGSQGPTLVGNFVFQAGKSGTAYVLRRDHLGGIGGQVSKGTVCKSFGGTAVHGSSVYVPCTDGVRQVDISSTGAMHIAWRASSGTTGAPVVGGGRVWALDTGAGVLHALSETNGASLASVSVGSVTRFATMSVYGPTIVVPTTTGITVVRTS